MKSDITPNRYYIECACHRPDHLLVFDYDIDDGWCFIYNTSNWRYPWYRRVWLALKYIFIKEDFLLNNDSIVITDENVMQIEEMVRLIKKWRGKKPQPQR